MESPVFDIIRKAKHEHALMIERELLKKLSMFGIHFSSVEEQNIFLKKNITRLAFDDNPKYFELYYNFKSLTLRGSFLFSYSDEITIDHENGRLKIG